MPLNFGGQKRSGAFDTVWPPAKIYVALANLDVLLSRLMDLCLAWEGRDINKKGLRGRNSPMCTLSQNGYGDIHHRLTGPASIVLALASVQPVRTFRQGSAGICSSLLDNTTSVQMVGPDHHACYGISCDDAGSCGTAPLAHHFHKGEQDAMPIASANILRHKEDWHCARGGSRGDPRLLLRDSPGLEPQIRISCANVAPLPRVRFPNLKIQGAQEAQESQALRRADRRCG